MTANLPECAASRVGDKTCDSRSFNSISIRMLPLLKKHKIFVGQVATMMSGKSIASMIALLTMPIIARLFSPEDFGVAAIFLSLSVLVANVGALRYETALVLPKQEAEALLLMALTYRIMAALCLAMLLAIFIYRVVGIPIQVLESLGIWLWLWPLGVLLLTMIQIQENWLARKRQFGVVAASMVVGTAVTGGSRIGFGLFSGTSTFGLIVGHMTGQICRLAVQKTASREGLKATFQRIELAELRGVAAKYVDFPKLNAPAALLSAATQQLPVVLFGALFAPAIVGYYSMAMRLAHVPSVIVANSVRRVFLQKAAEINNRGKGLTFAFLMLTGGLALLGVIPLAALWFFGEPLCTWLLGDRWTQAGLYLEIISPWLFMLLVSAPANPIFVVLRKQSLWLRLQITLTILRLGTFGLAYIVGAGPEWTLGAFVAATVVGNLSVIGIALILARRHRGSVPTEAL